MGIDVTCDCGLALKLRSTEIDQDGDINIITEQCDSCMEESFNDGKKEGINEAEESQ